MDADSCAKFQWRLLCGSERWTYYCTRQKWRIRTVACEYTTCLYRTTINQNHFYYFLFRKKQSDDGTGLICNNIFTGIYSFPLDCKPDKGKEFFIAHYTPVHSYKEWIEKNASNMHGPTLLLILTASLTFIMRCVL